MQQKKNRPEVAEKKLIIETKIILPSDKSGY